MAQGGTLGQRITDLIGSDYSTEAAYAGDLINAAINEIADMLSEDLLLKYSPTPTSVTSSSGVNIEGKKVLKVTRVDADSGGIERECSPLDRVSFASARDANSIYKATEYSPVYRLDSYNAATTVVIYPDCNNSGQEGNIWYFEYVTSSSPDGDITDLTESTLNTAVYLPNNLMHAIALKSSINILKAFISNQVQDEEDIELMQMIQSQMGVLEQDFQNEIQRYVPGRETTETGGE